MSRCGRKLSEATKLKISLAHIGLHPSPEAVAKMKAALTGRKLSDEHRKKISAALIGNNRSLGYKHPHEFSLIQSKAQTGNKNAVGNSSRLGKCHTEDSKKKISASKLGSKATLKTRIKMSAMRKGPRGSNWKGGVTPENRKIRVSIESRLWREAMYARDGFTCQKCETTGVYLHPHHIRNFAEVPELRFAIDNGITFCRGCHKQFHHLYGFKNNQGWQVEEFISSDVLKSVGES